MPLFSPVGSGGIGKAVITSTTGSPAIDTTSRPGKKIHTFTGNGSITVGTAGYVECLVVAGGGGGYSGGGGGGGLIYNASYFLPVGTHTITVGSGGAYTAASPAAAFPGGVSTLGQLAAVGGGAVGDDTQRSPAVNGGSGAGQHYNNYPVGSGVPGQGNGGGAGNLNGFWGFGGGGGAGQAGFPGSNGANIGGKGGDGLAYSITGTSVYYSGGGGGAYSNTGSYGANGLGGGSSSYGGGGGPYSNGGPGIVVVVTG